MRALKYLAAFTIPMTAVFSFHAHGWMTFSTLLYAFFLLPIVEFVLGENAINLDAAEKELAKKDRVYDIILYLTVPVQFVCLYLFLNEMTHGLNGTIDIVGKITAMGIMCGVLGINVAHELGHRTTRFEQVLAKVMLCSSLYMHFFIEHNRGHHRNVGTIEDAATARKDESVYFFWMRVIPQSFFSAWRIVAHERSRKKRRIWSIENEMLQFLLIQTAFCLLIALQFGLMAFLYFVISAMVGILLLETVNYVEHYGLYRKRINEFRYEDVQPQHSWNSDFVIGRIFLFELTRHSDHHWEPSKHYQLLESMPKASQLPAGYPAMMLLSLLPPLWFRVMNARLAPNSLSSEIVSNHNGSF